jgi:thiamine-phosphate kinase
MNEFELINRYFKRSAMSNTIALGVGDDCSLLNVPSGRQLAVSVDTLVADVHFPADGDPQAIAERALCVSLSDLAAMGASPLWFTLCLTLPQADERWVAPFSEGLLRVAGHYGCELVGGDTTKGPLAISVQVMGSVEPGKAFVRSGAQPDDLIYVTGTLGDGAAALAAFNRKIKPNSDAFHYLTQRYYHPIPRFNEAGRLAPHVSAAIDVSDGLMADLGHICAASGVGAEVYVENLPVSEAVENFSSNRQQREWALSGGDDYQLCFTVPREHVPAVEVLIGGGLKACNIGKITRGNRVACLLLGEPFTLASKGYNHFG